MQLEASTSLGDAPPVAEEAMTIDYDLDPAHSAEGGDAEMGDDHHPSSPTKNLTDLAVLEADMVDDDALAQHSAVGDTTVLNGDAEIEDAATFPPSSSTLDDVPFSSIDTAPIPAFSSAPGASAASLAPADVDFAAAAADPTLAPEPAFSSSAPAATPAAPVEPAATVNAAFSLGDGGAAVSALETLDEAEPAGELTPPEPSTTAELAEELDLVPNGDEATSIEDPVEAVIVTAAHEGDDADSQREDADSQREDGDATGAKAAVEQGDAASVPSPSQSQGVSSRPLVNKDPLLDVEVPVRSPANPSSSSSRGVPAVFLSIGAPHGWTTYSLFHAERRDAADDEQDEHVKEDDVELLLGDAAQHYLYYEPLDALFGALRAHLEYLGHDGDELVLEFDEIGLSITEDNVYAHQVTLFDFDRIHTGCQIPGRLHANLATQPRFSSGFNALAQHIALGSQSESVEDDGGEGEEAEGGPVHDGEEPAEGEPLEDEEEDAEHDESGTLEGDDDELEEAQVAEGEPLPSGAEEVGGAGGDAEQAEEGEEDGELAEGPADDHDGPDSELVDSRDDDDEPVQDDAQPAEDEFDLESALAELDGDDVVAVIEGAQEDLLLHGVDGGEPDEALEAPAPETEQDEDGAESSLAAAGQSADATEDGPSQAAEVEQSVEAAGSLEEMPGAVAGDAAAGPVSVPGADEPASAPGATDEVSFTATAVETSAPVEGQATSTADGPVAESSELEAAAPVAPSAPADLAPAPELSATAPVDDLEKPAGPADVVIDYDDAFDGSAEPAPSGDKLGGSPESKRTRDDDGQDAEGEEAAGDSKRPRLSDPVDAASS
ncbi:uncharacterized protein RHOBADRAFT_54047 [Rhodotorula graminis WP1]|uniref:Uncharacterized protein n=1 Tax=Rhodotorula graminis (strain WP1) TaxID=578459 RepID=A0A194S0Y3_RHOGW|nr:uncharacterized protein RHOBADRAFT_54047 [Rhodotorula graminis WP1]KPV74194.1 hypothetical protein RHOBADRAFT_54047 [Rhodotorula graminis WP1]